MDAQDPKKTLDFDEIRAVQRESHQLSISHGIGAHLYALRFAEKAKANNDQNAERLWRAVYDALRPR